ncbi:DUF4336 domain-containing protein [Polyangium spumosum]|uniref:DUF4336 domain-containing protein n=1 Tax=Polyangium spumosum TaxID=889282 RepID=A0A6N7PV54_9BACT|nr:DUF4336 domain-containing protein [Polyangium spumosum]MRG95789.1 DUF4336 domain-containing protein [Polyangium spumosum]
MAELVPLAEDLWAAEHPLRFAGFLRMNARMTVARLSGGELWVHSPIPIDDSMAAALAKLGRVAYLVAPNRFHNLYIGAASARYPEARVFAAPRVEEKIPSVRIDEVLSADPPAAWGGDVETRLVEGAPMMSEVVFLHHASRTLIVTDLLFNIEEPEGLVSRVVYAAMGTNGKLAMGREWPLIAKDRAALRASVRAVAGLDFDRLIMAHGSVVAEGAKDRVSEALRSYL